MANTKHEDAVMKMGFDYFRRRFVWDAGNFKRFGKGQRIKRDFDIKKTGIDRENASRR